MGRIDADLRQVTFALSDALDLVGIDDTHHGKRVAFMATKCAQAMGLPDDAVGTLFFSGMLHDCGVSSTDIHHDLVSNLERPDEDSHCAVGAEMLSGFEPLADLAPIIRWHHAHWPVLTGKADVPAEVAEMANLIFLVDRVDALVAMQGDDDHLVTRRAVMDTVRGLSGTFFKPELVDALDRAAESEAFWLAQDPEAVNEFLTNILTHQKVVSLSMPELKSLAGLFARIVDAKSPYTAEHSAGVARVAARLAAANGIDGPRRDQIEVAALLHDLGKLRVPDEVLDKPGPLNEEERAHILRHSFDTYRILSHVDGFKDIARWAGFHHETMSGTGYPFHVEGRDLPLEARVIAVADVFQALAQDRPYRAGLHPGEILDILRDMSAHDHLDATLVEQVAADLDGTYAVAV